MFYTQLMSLAGSLVDYVEPRLGTRHTRWIHFTSAGRPFAMASLSPDTRVDGDWGCGYALQDESIIGISHIHDWQLSGLLVMPVSGNHPDRGREALRSAFDRRAELCKPGDHRLLLQRDGTSVELTSTLRTGWHRFKFTSGIERYIILDLAGPLGPCSMSDAMIRQIGPRCFEAAVTNDATRRRSQPSRIHFFIELDTDAKLEMPGGLN